VDDNFDTYLSSTILRFIRFKASQIAGRYGYRRDEIEDIQQTLIVECMERLPRFDTRRAGQRTFMRLVINRGIATLVGSQKTRCRDFRLCQQSLDSAGDSADCIRFLRHVDNDIGEFELRSDVTRVLSQLDAADRRVAVALMEYSPMEASRKLRIARSTIYQHIGRLRARFIAAGITTGCTAQNRC
jgi:RNA polymerase sigma-70 factor (ECF subfamily)